MLVAQGILTRRKFFRKTASQMSGSQLLTVLIRAEAPCRLALLPGHVLGSEVEKWKREIRRNCNVRTGMKECFFKGINNKFSLWHLLSFFSLSLGAKHKKPKLSIVICSDSKRSWKPLFKLWVLVSHSGSEKVQKSPPTPPPNPHPRTHPAGKSLRLMLHLHGH